MQNAKRKRNLLEATSIPFEQEETREGKKEWQDRERQERNEDEIFGQRSYIEVENRSSIYLIVEVNHNSITQKKSLTFFTHSHFNIFLIKTKIILISTSNKFYEDEAF